MALYLPIVRLGQEYLQNGHDYNGEGYQGGVIPNVMDTIFFSKMESMNECIEFLVGEFFIEIFKEEIFDLLDPTPAFSKVEAPSMAKIVGPARTPIQIRETVSGWITLAGVTEAESITCNFHNIHGTKKVALSSSGDDVGDEILMAKLHLVELVGSKCTKG